MASPPTQATAEQSAHNISGNIEPASGAACHLHTLRRWMDDVCVDQDGLGERRGQVPRTSYSYIPAYNLFAWLNTDVTRERRHLELELLDQSTKSHERPETYILWGRYAIPRTPRYRGQIRRIGLRSANALSIAAGYVSTVTMVNFNQAQSTCPEPGNDYRWPSILPLANHLPDTIKCPTGPAACAAFAAWSFVGVLNLPWSPKFWPECGLVALAVSIVTGGLLGFDAMTNALLIGGFLSFVFAKTIEGLRRQPGRELGCILPLSGNDAPPMRGFGVRPGQDCGWGEKESRKDAC